MNFYTNVALQKNDILVRGYENGVRIQKRIPYKPYLFVPTHKETKYTTLQGVSVGKIDFDSIREARDFMNQYKDVSGFSFYGLTNFVYTFIYDEYKGEINYDTSLIVTVGLDIEVDISGDRGFPNIQEANNEITLVTLSCKGKKFVFGCGDFTTTEKHITYIKCKNEHALLIKLIEAWQVLNPDIVTGWNVEFFDIPYIINRVSKVLGPSFAKKFSPWSILYETTVEIMGKENQVWVPVGITVLDYLQLYKKFAYTQQESYTLDHVAYQELGERKLDYGEYGSLAGLQTQNWQMYCEYNIRDVELVDKLEDKLKLIELVLAMAYDAKINFQDTFTTVRSWDIIIHHYLRDRNIVVHQFEKSEIDRKIMGGYVKDPQVGMHDWVVSLDLNSLYPHLIMQYNISPETFRGMYPHSFQIEDLLEGKLNDENVRRHLYENNVAVTANMCTFTREKQGFLPELMQRFYDARSAYKNKMIAAKKELQQIDAELKRRCIEIS